jgi:aspartyl-tRNA(Asn)/glutamyl-tRNA(Gln) amidotransferase subunit C
VTRISREQVDRVAALARLSFSENEAERIGADLEAILGYVETLNELDTEGIEPMSHVIPLETPVREDRAVAALDPELAVANAPVRDGTAFVVPKVIEGDDEG